MGSFDGAEICELVGLYIQSRLEHILPKNNFGLILLRTLMASKWRNRENLSSKFSKALFLVLTFKQILKKLIFLTLYRTYKVELNDKVNCKLHHIHSSFEPSTANHQTVTKFHL